MSKTRFDAQVLTPYLRWGRLAAMTFEDHLASDHRKPAAQIRKPSTFLQIQAQHRNVARSTGPRTSGGKRRAALNSIKWQQCSKAEQMIMALEGRNPFEYRRLYRQLIYWFEPWDSYSRRLVARVAEDWWAKLGAPRAQRACQKRFELLARGIRNGKSANADSRRQLDRNVERSLGLLVDTLSLRSRKWKYLLGSRLERPLQECKTASDLGREIESELRAAHIPVKHPHVTRMKKSHMNTGRKRNKIENVRLERDVFSWQSH